MINQNSNAVDLSQYGENKLSGLYRARVEDVQDPMKIARVRVRVPMLHGTEGGSNYIANEGLPWATMLTPYGAGYDHGACAVPEVGDVVLVMFEDNDRNYPVYLGGCYGRGGTVKQYGSSNDPSTYAGGTWSMPYGRNEVPNEVYGQSNEPTGKVIYKSPKGATIMIEESDGKESLRILDVLGQSIHMDTSLTASTNSGNGGRRINADAYYGTQHKASRLSKDGYAEIAITDASGQQIQMLSSGFGSSIRIRSGENGSGAQVVLEKTGVEIEYEGNQIQLQEDNARVEVGAHHIHLGADGSVEIAGAAKIIISPSGQIQIEGTDHLTLTANTVEVDSNTCIIRGDLINYSN